MSTLGDGMLSTWHPIHMLTYYPEMMRESERKREKRICAGTLALWLHNPWNGDEQAQCKPTKANLT
jgi:hypothetical protein